MPTVSQNQDLEALTAQIAELTRQVRGLAQRELTVEAIYHTGFADGQAAAGDPVPGHAARPATILRARPGHLHLISGGAS
jgi:hypothetical protein